MADVIEVNDIDELGAYRMAWDSLFAETPNATFFQTFDWLSLYWRHFGQGQELRVLIVRSEGRPIGILPLCVKTERRRIGPVRVLNYPLDNWSHSFGPIGRNQTATLAMGMRHLASTPRDFDLVDLRWIPEESLDRGRARRAMNSAGWNPSRELDQRTSLVETSCSWEDYLSSRRSKIRHEFRRHLRRCERAGQVEHIRHRPAPLREGDGDPRWDLYAMCQDVAEKSWQSHSTTGNTISNDRLRAFIRDTHAAAARRGMLDLNLLLIDGEPVAFNYNYYNDGRITGLRMGYDPDRAQHCVGLALTLKTLQEGCLRGDSLYDLGAGEQDYKRRVRTSQETTCRLIHSPLASWRSQALRLGRWVQGGHKLEEAASGKNASA